MESIRIGALAKRAGVGIDTVRYYERNRLLTPRDRSASGYRRYGELELSRLHFIRRAQALGFSLREVRDLLSISAQRDVARIKRTAQTKLADIDQRVLARQRIRNGLATLIAACPGSWTSGGLSHPERPERLGA